MLQEPFDKHILSEYLYISHDYTENTQTNKQRQTLYNICELYLLWATRVLPLEIWVYEQ